MATASINLDPTKVLQFVEVASAFGKRAIDEANQYKAAQKRAADLKATVLTALLETGTIDPRQKEAAATALSDHASTMAMLKNAVDKLGKFKSVKTAGAGTLGRGVDDDLSPTEKAAASLTSPFVGQRTSERKASDVALLTAMNVPMAR